MKDYYAILEIPRNASEDDIKRAYKKSALKFHPDKGGDPERFKEISEAYQILQDPQKKAAYDRGEEFQEHHNPFEHNSFFQNFFNHAMGGMGGMGPMGGMGVHKRSNHQHQITIDLRDVHTGLEKNMKINIKKPCFDCKKPCPHCDGRGMIFIRHGPIQMQQSCNACRSCGLIDSKNPNCTRCKGSCYINEDQICKIVIEKGVANGSFIKLDGLGEQPQKRGEIPGDLIFQINVKTHPFFNRDNNDIVYTLAISFKESIVGKNITVPHFDGDIPIYTGNFGVINPNQAYRLKGKGLAGRGDLVLLFNIDYPAKKYDEELLDKFRELSF
jgi:DnaJ-class molecular chaperone